VRPVTGGTQGHRDFWLLACWEEEYITFIYETGWKGLLAVGVLGRGILTLYMILVGWTSGCRRDWLRNITLIYETSKRDFWLLACWVEEYYLYI
jgi:hypothetical protein